jgi:hypothetical protein
MNTETSFVRDSCSKRVTTFITESLERSRVPRSKNSLSFPFTSVKAALNHYFNSDSVSANCELERASNFNLGSTKAYIKHKKISYYCFYNTH